MSRPHSFETLYDTGELEKQYVATPDEARLLSETDFRESDLPDILESIGPSTPSLFVTCYCMMRCEGDIRKAAVLLRASSLNEESRLMALAFIWYQRQKIAGT